MLRIMNRKISTVAKLAVITIACFVAASCVSLQSVSLTQIPKQRNKTVTAETSRMIIFFFNFDNDYVDEVRDQLKEQCQGKITGILTKDETINYFLYLVMKRRVWATGYCTEG